MPELEGLNQYAFDYELGLDAKNESANLYLGLVNDSSDTTVLDGNFYIMNDTLYMESGKIFEGLLFTPVDFVMEMP